MKSFGFLLLLAQMSDIMDADSLFPTQSQQVNLLTNVEELFELVQQTAREELSAMEKTMRHTVDQTLSRAKYTIVLLQELSILKLSTRSNAVCSFTAQDVVQKVTMEGFQTIEECTNQGSYDIEISSNNLANITNTGIDHAGRFLDKLKKCSKKKGLAIITCYKHIIDTDVLPVKRLISHSITDYRDTYLKTFDLYTMVSMCIDLSVEGVKNNLEKAVEDGLNCNK
ncbi:hypothetical protein GWI33_017335 [Rhynchophorus ferrugineus]|uniref:Secreted protein n=1 Tax=Rhynchophorus ferrugineus TaxID=354439 RepID=A0A834M7S5_RHYFE|nr:hypothetical protein GWI33_017335 [Rhynchophorus ferrugineus]